MMTITLLDSPVCGPSVLIDQDPTMTHDKGGYLLPVVQRFTSYLSIHESVRFRSMENLGNLICLEIDL